MRERVLAWVSVDSESSEDRLAARWAAIRCVLLLAITAEHWNRLAHWKTAESAALHLTMTLLVTGAVPLSWFERWGRVSLWIACLVAGVKVASSPAHAANHEYLIFFCSLVLASAATERADEKRLALNGLRWFVVIGVFWSGTQKLLHGYYFGGEFLSYMIATEERFASAFAALVPVGELSRLRALEAIKGAGAFRVDSLAFVLASNVAMLCELVLPLLLLIRRARPFAICALLAFYVAIEVGAREVFFGLWIAQLTLLHAERDWVVRLLRVTLGAYLYLLAMDAGLLPRWFFT